MPRSIVFNVDSESHFPLHSHYLLGRKYQPAYKVWQAAKREGLAYTDLMNRRDLERTRNHHVPEKILVEWMYDFMRDIENFMDEERFHFEFSYYMAVSYGDEESEFVSRASCPMWFVTIRDFEKSIVHKNWTIAFDDWADILIKRGKATSEDPMSNAPMFDEFKKMKSKLFCAIKEHIRIRNFRLKRLGKEVTL